MKSYKHLVAETRQETTITIALTQMCPPTIGHDKIIKTVLEGDGQHVVFLGESSQFQVDPEQRLAWTKKSYPNVNFVSGVSSIIEAVGKVNGLADHLVVVAGSDKVASYKSILEKYNGTQFQFKSISVVSSGAFDPDSETSTSSMRASVLSNDFSNFRRTISENFTENESKKILDEIRLGLGFKRSVDESMEICKTRDAFYRGQQFLVGQVVKEGDHRFEIIARGSNYVTVVDESGTICKKFVNKLTVVDEQMNYGDSLYKGIDLSDSQLADKIRSVISEDVKDPFAMIRVLQNLEEFTKGSVDNLDRAYDSLDNTGISESLTTILESMSERPSVKPSDKLRVAKIIADALGADSSSNNPDQMVNSALRGVKSKSLGKNLLPIIQNMVSLAKEVGIKIDSSVIPAGVTESENLDEISQNTLKSYTQKAMRDTLSGKKDRNKGMQKAYSRLAGTDKPLVKEDEDPDVHSYGLEMDALGFEQLRKHLMQHTTLKNGSEPVLSSDSNKPGHSLDAKDILRKMKARKLKGHD